MTSNINNIDNPTHTTNIRFRLVAIFIIIIAIGIAFWRWSYHESSSLKQSTDDAYIQADLTIIVPQVSGIIKEIAVLEHQFVKAGDKLISIDDRELNISVNSAKATIDNLTAKLKQQQSIIAQAQAIVESMSAKLNLAQTNRTRYSNLANDGSGTVLDKQQAETELKIQHASFKKAQAELNSAILQVDILQADLSKAEATKEDAELKLSYASIKAPISGIVDQRYARIGGYARIGEPLLTLVPLNEVYIEANFRETQLACVKVSQTVDIKVDALPDVILKGYIDSIAPASGVSYSLIPPHNATGNFTKIVQRLPIRIKFEPNQENIKRLKVGMSVQPTININNCN